MTIKQAVFVAALFGAVCGLLAFGLSAHADENGSYPQQWALACSNRVVVTNKMDSAAELAVWREFAAGHISSERAHALLSQVLRGAAPPDQLEYYLGHVEQFMNRCILPARLVFMEKRA